MIDKFAGQYRFLSNFYPARVMLYDRYYPTVEHAYQAAKCQDTSQYRLFYTSECPTPAMAKNLGSSVCLREDWEHVKIEIMRSLLYQKFSVLGPLCTKLLATDPHELVEGNTWGDTFWGMCKGNGLNNLGILLMTIRDDRKAPVY